MSLSLTWIRPVSKAELVADVQEALALKQNSKD